LACLLCIPLLSSGHHLSAQESVINDAPAESDTAEGDIPEPLTHYKGRLIAQTMSFHGAPWLTRDNREQEENGRALHAALNLKPGQVVCDMGCGNGYHTFKLSRKVGPEGRVLAVDIQPEMLHLLSERAKRSKLDNIELIQGSVVDPHLPEGELDLILLVDVYHEFSHPEQMLAAMRKSLKPDGRLVLVEFREEDPTVPIKPEHKMSKEQMLRELLPNGFVLVEQFDKLPWQHVMFFSPAPAE
jgi:ubiquinone/menaquinone biosynthesis C-methylase UbiE